MKRVSRRVCRALARKVEQKHIPIKSLAHSAGYDVRTIRNFLNGESVRDETIRKICSAAGIDFEKETEQSVIGTKSSHQDHGAYSKDFVRSYIGAFYAYRRSFSVPGNLVRSLYSFEWDANRSCLRFKEFQNYHSSHLHRRVNYDQEGDVYISNAIGLVHLLTIKQGALRLITLTRLHPDENIMRGAVVTQAEWPDHYQPSVSPIYFRKILEPNDLAELARRVGPIEPRDPDYETASSELFYTESDVANFAKAGPALRSQ